jgi:hypothetical protein
MKHKVIGLLAVYGLYSAMGLFGLFLRAADFDTPSPTPAPKQPPSTPAAPMTSAAPTSIGQIGQLNGLGQIDQFGPLNPLGPFGGFGQIGGFSRPIQFGGKIGIERGPTQVLATRTSAAVPPPGTKDNFVNPKVEPGKVIWHPDFDTACKAAATSGKPVLLFQMMGKLDDQFC